MGIFRRGGKKPAEDAGFPFLSRDEGVHLRHLVRSAFAARGLTVRVHDTYACDEAYERAARTGNGTGVYINLANLAARCHELRGVTNWSDVVADHVAKLMRSGAAAALGGSPLPDVPSPDLDPEQVRAAVYPRLSTDELHAVAPGFDYARLRAPGLRELLAVQLDGTLHTLADRQIARLGGPGRLWEAAYENLRALPLQHTVRTTEHGGHYDVLTGDCPHYAALAVVVDDVLRRIRGEEVVPEDGVLVGIPRRDVLLLHRIGDARIATSMADVAVATARLWDAAPYPISPELFWWRNGVLTRLGRHTAQGIGVDLRSTGFAAVIAREAGR